MKRTLSILFLFATLLCASAQVIPTNEINGTLNSSSYGSIPVSFWEDYFATHFYNLYPQWTNHIYDVSQSGSGWQGDFENNEEKWCLPLWASFAVPGNDWILANDNGDYSSDTIVHWGTNLFNAPPLFWNGTAVTNEGVATAGITHFPLGNIIQDTSGGDGGAIARNAACNTLAASLGVPQVDIWHALSPGWVPDQAGARKLGFMAGSHPYAAGYLCVAMKALIALGAETNVSAMTLDWTNHSVSATNKCTVTSPSLTGNTLTFTVHYDRMPMAWDVPDGTITNDARNAFAVMPELGNAFNWTIQVTNLPVGNYQIFVDGVLTDTATSVQLAAGRNWFTNYNGPLWAQRVAVLAAKRAQNGIDPVTLQQIHDAGSVGSLGFKDLLNYHSSAGGAWTANFRGTALTNIMADNIAQLQHYDVAIHNAAAQVNHTFSMSLLPSRTAPAHR